ncbi:hypothetical protein MTO96_003872 [Rhipicephalus appendiculatus]
MVKSDENKAADLEAGPSGAAPRNKSGGGNAVVRTARQGNTLLLRDLIVPSLDNKCYGDDLKWVDRTTGRFLIRWTHQSSRNFNREDPNVFQDWSVKKGKWVDKEPNRLSKAKQRMRAAFLKLPNLLREKKSTDHRIYRIKNIDDYPIRTTKAASQTSRPCNCTPEGRRPPGSRGQRLRPPHLPLDDSATDASSDTSSRTSSEAENPGGAFVVSKTWTPADTEVVCILVSMKHGFDWQRKFPQSAAHSLALSLQGILPPAETRQVDQVDPMEASVSNMETSSAEEEGISAPDSVVVKQEQVDAAMATAPLYAQP